VCPFVPVMVISPRSRLILLRGVLCSSSPSAPISARIVKIVVYWHVEADIMVATSLGVGIIGVPSASL
jgi:hypothetical protein